MIIALIPARCGSRGVPDKNIKPIGGLPLLAWSVIAALKTQSVDSVVVSSDSIKYLRIAAQYGAECCHRSQAAAGDTAGDEAVIKDFLQFKPELRDLKLIVYLRPTTPFREPVIINEAIKTLQDAPGSTISPTSMRSIEPMSESAYKCLQVRQDGFLTGISGHTVEDAGKPRQSFPETYRPNGYVDIIRLQYFLETGNLWGDKVMPFFTEPTIEIDTPGDMVRAVRYAGEELELTEFYQKAAGRIKPANPPTA